MLSSVSLLDHGFFTATPSHAIIPFFVRYGCRENGYDYGYLAGTEYGSALDVCSKDGSGSMKYIGRYDLFTERTIWVDVISYTASDCSGTSNPGAEIRYNACSTDPDPYNNDYSGYYQRAAYTTGLPTSGGNAPAVLLK
jgi:hypothetical protein